MDKNGIGLDEITSSGDGTWCLHVCECGYTWDSTMVVDTCWLCSRSSVSLVDQAAVDEAARMIGSEPVPDDLLEDMDRKALEAGKPELRKEND